MGSEGIVVDEVLRPRFSGQGGGFARRDLPLGDLGEQGPQVAVGIVGEARRLHRVGGDWAAASGAGVRKKNAAPKARSNTMAHARAAWRGKSPLKGGRATN